jgi:hypothetical protein
MVVPEPVYETPVRLAAARAETDSEGPTTISGLVAGTYRAIALAKEIDWATDPLLIPRLRSGKEVNLGVNDSALIQLRAVRTTSR